MMEFIIIVAAIVVGLLITGAISIALMFNKTFMNWMFKKYMNLITDEIEKKVEEESL